GPVAGIAVTASRREGAGQVAPGRDTVGFVEGARPPGDITESRGGAFDVTVEAVDHGGVVPATAGHRPARRREVVVGDDWGDAVVEAGLAHPPVVVEGGLGELAFGRLDTAPLDREAIG